MDSMTSYSSRNREIIEGILTEYVSIQYANGEIQNEAVFDRERDRYLVVSVGWQGARRVQHCLLHIDIKDGKIWIQKDGTEDGIAYALEQAGIPKNDIVLGFQPANVRQHADYAVA